MTETGLGIDRVTGGHRTRDMGSEGERLSNRRQLYGKWYGNCKGGGVAIAVYIDNK